MFVKSDIRKVTIALEKALGQEVYLRLGRAGIIHLARMQPGDALTDQGFHALEGLTRDILAGGVFILNALGIEAGEALPLDEARDADRDAAFVSQAKKNMERLQRLRKRIQDKLALVGEQLIYAEALSRMGIDPETVRRARLVQAVFGRVAEPVPDLPEDGTFMLARTGLFVFGAALPKAAPRMLRFLGKYGFIDMTEAIGGASPERLKRRDADLNRRLDILDRYADRFREDKGPSFERMYQAYLGYEEVLKAMRLSIFSAKAIFILGWMDAGDRQRLVAILREVCDERFVLCEEKDPGAPVRLMNMRLFKPFELIVKTMGMPANSEIDPTPLAAVTFVLVFGLMFGDLGQGLVLAAAGLVLKWIAKRRAREDLGQAGGILVACGLCAAFCGMLYGSLFSSEHLIPALWIHPVERIMDLFAVTIFIGAVVIMVGLSVNIINALINTDYPEAFLEKKGLAVLILYSAIVVMAVRYAKHGQMPASWEIAAFIILPMIVFSLRGVLGPILFRAHRPHDVAEYVTETVMEIVEIGLSMFANTVSFIRVGAFALSHAGLSVVTYSLAGMVDQALKSPGAIAVIVAGNIVIIGFEGLICGIQSMRLEYYEFFSKFYKGDGTVFSPFALKARQTEV